MKKVIQIILMSLGVLFLIQLSLMAWFYLSDPFGLFGSVAVVETVVEENNTETSGVITKDETGVEEETSVTGPSQAQIDAASQVGIEITTFTSDQVACFKTILGEERVNEVVAGAVPSPLEFYRVKGCLN